MATSGYIEDIYKWQGSKQSPGGYRYAKLSWSKISSDKNNGTTTINFKLEASAYTYQALQTTVNLSGWNGTATINGINIPLNWNSGDIYKGELYVAANNRLVIPHNADGTKTFTYSFNLNYGELSASGTGELDPIYKNAYLIGAPNFTDEDNPVITYRNPAGTAASSVQACISFTGATDDVPYREIDRTGGANRNYIFELTNSERNTLRTGIGNNTSASVRFYIKTIIDGVEYYDYVTKTVSLINHEPVVASKNVVDNNSDTRRLTGNQNYLVRYMSDAYVTSSSVARKGATVTSQDVRNGDKIISAASGTFSGVESNTFYFSVKDSRGIVTNDFIVFNETSTQRKWIPYVKLTCRVDASTLDGGGNLNVKLSGKYYSGSFGAANNKFVLEYRINPTNVEEAAKTSWQYYNGNGIVSPSISADDTYEYTFTLTGLNYKEIYNLEIRVSDELMTVTPSNTVVAASIPVFDWSRNDFKFNVPVSMSEGYSYPQRLLWSGASVMGGGEVIDLSDTPISSMPSGIVLVFSLYRDEVVEDVSVHSFFISKAEVVHLFPDNTNADGVPHVFWLAMNPSFATIGAKYLYIKDDKITGYSGNRTNSTLSPSGIPYSNGMFVLRYVIGV